MNYHRNSSKLLYNKSDMTFWIRFLLWSQISQSLIYYIITEYYSKSDCWRLIIKCLNKDFLLPKCEKSPTRSSLFINLIKHYAKIALHCDNIDILYNFLLHIITHNRWHTREPDLRWKLFKGKMSFHINRFRRWFS